MGHELTLLKTCPMCGKAGKMIMDDSHAIEYMRYNRGEGAIQDVMVSFNATEREFAKTGFCPNCQKMLFANYVPSDMIKYREA